MNMLSVWHKLAPAYRKEVAEVALKHLKIDHATLLLMSISEFNERFAMGCCCPGCTFIRNITQREEKK